VTPEKVAAGLPPLTEEQVQKVAALLLIALDRPQPESAE
jgi:hypothetical protein